MIETQANTNNKSGIYRNHLHDKKEFCPIPCPFGGRAANLGSDFMKKKSASKKRNQEMREEIEGLNKTIARMKDSHYDELHAIRKMIEASYHQWLMEIEASDSYKQLLKEHPLLRWEQPLRLCRHHGFVKCPNNYLRGEKGWRADALYFATRTGSDFGHYRFYKECLEAGLLVGDKNADPDWRFHEPTPSQVALMRPNQKLVEKYWFGDEERRKAILAKIKRKFVDD